MEEPPLKHWISVFTGNGPASTGIADDVIELEWNDVAKIVTTTNWAPGTFLDNRRSIASFQQTSLLALDVDSECSVATAASLFGEYRHIIAASRNHQKEKVTRSGKTLPACDRFRIILPLNEVITNDADFKATWFAAQKICGAIDPACKDASRFFFPSTKILHTNEGRAFPVVKAKSEVPAKNETPVSISTGMRLSPSMRTMKFATMGAPDGQWHGEMVAACMDLKQQQWGIDEARKFLMKASPILQLDEHDEGVIQDIWANRTPRHQPRIQQNDSLARLIKQCHMLVNVADPSDVRMVDLTNGAVHDIHPDTVKLELRGEDYKDYVRARRICCHFTYDPRIIGPLTLDPETGIHIYNTYVPPKWREAQYYKGDELAPISQLPDVFDRFFTHLTGAHAESKEYLLDWLATSMQGRNFTILTAIGEQGIGKGTLGEVMRKLHGDSNFSEATDKIFKERFNGKLESKTLVYVDEIDLKTKESQDRIKAVVNEYIEVEKKGIDAITVKNHASFYISSNSMDAIKLDAGDRRYSIIQLTDTKLVSTPLIKEIQSIVGDDSVGALGRYLIGRKVGRDMLVPFRSPRFEQVKVAGLQDWELYVLEEFIPKHAGGTPLLRDAQEAIEQAGVLKRAPGWRKFSDLSKKYPDMFRLKQRYQDGGRHLEIPRKPRGFGDAA